MDVLAFTWTDFAQQIVLGLATGSIYASLALAIVIIYRSTGVINFAQGEMAMLSTFFAWWLVADPDGPDLPFWVGFALTLAVSFAGGVVIERLFIRPVEGAPVLTIVMVTLGIGIALFGIAGWIWGAETRSFPSAFSTRTVDIGGVIVSIQDVGFIAVTMGAVGLLYLFFQFTKVGLGLRAAAGDRESSRLLGVRVSWMFALGWGIAAMLGALAGMMTAPTTQLDPNMMRGVLLYAFAAAVLGGLDSPIGAVVGGLSLGVALNLLGTYSEDIFGYDVFSGEMRLVGGLLVILAVLFFRPQGLFGKRAVRRV
jgi:branched-chain amino acid transport system permease protein